MASFTVLRLNDPVGMASVLLEADSGETYPKDVSIVGVTTEDEFNALMAVHLQQFADELATRDACQALTDSLAKTYLNQAQDVSVDDRGAVTVSARVSPSITPVAEPPVKADL